MADFKVGAARDLAIVERLPGGWVGPRRRCNRGSPTNLKWRRATVEGVETQNPARPA